MSSVGCRAQYLEVQATTMFELAAKFAFWSGISMLGLVLVVNFVAVITSR